MKLVDNRDLVLPEFQRDFVWDIGKTYDLFDSLVRDIFIGSLIYGIPSFELTAREIDTRSRKEKGKRRKSLATKYYSNEEIDKRVKTSEFRLLLDGQQRITAIYRALTGIDPVWFVAKDDEELEEYLADNEFNKIPLENILYGFSGQQDPNRLSIDLKTVYSLLSGEIVMQDEIKRLYYDNLLFVQTLPDVDKTAHFIRFLVITQKLQKLFTGEKLISYYLLNMTSEKFALFFERSNSKGVQLNFIDILAAKLYHGFNLRKAIEDFESNYGGKYEFHREVVVRAIAYTVSNGKNVDKGFILTNLSFIDFQNHWDSTCNLFRSVIDFLSDNHFIVSQQWMPYENMIIPLMFFLGQLPQKQFSQMNEQQKEFIHFWYWSTVFAQRYSSSTNDVIIEDSNILRLIAAGRKITDKSYFTKLKVNISEEELLSYSKTGSAIYKGILNIINYNSKGLLDWTNTDKIALNSKVDDHHIFPKAYIKKISQDEDEYLEVMDCVANRALIPSLTNIKIGKKCPSEYLKLLEQKNPNLPKSLESHLISPDIISGLYDDFFIDFLEERCSRIFQVIEATVLNPHSKIVSSFYEQPKNRSSSTFKVFGKYKGKSVEATFNADTEEILYKGGVYSVSKAADLAKNELTGKEDSSTNGWTFWKYLDGLGNPRPLNDFRS